MLRPVGQLRRGGLWFEFFDRSRVPHRPCNIAFFSPLPSVGIIFLPLSMSMSYFRPSLRTTPIVPIMLGLVWWEGGGRGSRCSRCNNL